jgi:hypothetical protein
MATTYILESGDPYIRKRTEKGWTLDFVFNRDDYDWADGSTFYYWGISGETEQKNYADNNLSFSFTDDGRIMWKAIRYKYDSCKDLLYYTTTGQTAVFCTGGTLNDFNITITFERNIELNDCDLCNDGGINDLVTGKTIDSTLNFKNWLSGDTLNYFSIEEISKKYYNERNSRLGTLKIYLNGNPIYKLKNFEEVVPSTRQIERVSFDADGSQAIFDVGEDIGTLVNVLVDDNVKKQDVYFTHEENTSSIEFVEAKIPVSGSTITIVYFKTSLNPLVQVIGGGTNGINNFHTGQTLFDILYVKYLEAPLSALEVKNNYKNNIKLNYNISECNSCNDVPYSYSNPPTPTPTPTLTPTPTPTLTPTPTPTVTSTPSPTPTFFPTATPTSTPTPTPTFFPTSTPSPTPTITPTPTPYPFSTPLPSGFTFDADYIVVTYAFTDGADLDTRTRISNPDIGQNDLPTYIGWNRLNEFPESSETPILKWAGDNTGTGFESVLIDLIQLKSQFPQFSGSTITIDMNAMWYGSLGSNPVVMDVMMYKGGSMSLDEDAYLFVNNTYTGLYGVASTGTIVTLVSQNGEDQELVARLQYNLSNYIGNFI